MPTENNGTQHRTDYLELIEIVRTMTLATCGSHPWAAPVYYLYREKTFYFFSGPDARHIRDGEGEICAASIFTDSHEQTAIRGLQMAGRIEACRADRKAAAAAIAYAGKFGIKATGENFLEFFKKRYHARLYRFVPGEILYMDNRRGFGNRTKINL